MTLLSVKNLTVSVAGPKGRTTIVSDVSFDVPQAGAVALVGESGSGKSLTGYALMRLLPPGAEIDSGSIVFEGKELCGLRDRDMRKLRGAKIAMVFQEPSIALNPVYTIGTQITEAISLHESLSRTATRERAEAWLAKVGMPVPKRSMQSYPHELSGGMKQRALLAMALVAGPSLLVADEPTTSLDRTLEAQILSLLSHEREERKMALVLVSHDLATVAEVTDYALVMYAGQIVEQGRTLDLLAKPAHPYTRALVGSIVDPVAHGARTLGRPSPRLPVLKGAPPPFDDLPRGCRFAPRCPSVFDRCSEPVPLYELEGRQVRCFLHDPAEKEAS